MNARDIARLLADRAVDVAAHLLPGGKRHGKEWKTGSVNGEAGQSLSVCLSGEKRGVWADFASGEGGDLLDLWVACRCTSMAEAIREAKQYLGVRDTLPQPPAKTYRRPERQASCVTPKAGARDWLLGRGLAADTLAAFKIGEVVLSGKTYAVFPYLRDGELVNAKSRNVAEKRDMRQEAGAEPCLFGWHLIDPKARTVAITEGEIDAMTLHQAGIPALSVNQGAGNHQWIETDWERLERFSEVLIAFDDDDAGRKGAQEVANRLGIERCKVLTFTGHKDANEALVAGWQPADFREATMHARALDPEELVSIATFRNQVLAAFYPADGAPQLPTLRFGHADFDWFEFRPGEYSVWTGINGHGKSLMNNQVLLGLMAQGERVCVFSGELPAVAQFKRLVKQATGLDRPTPGFINAVADWVQDRMWIFNVAGTATLDRLLEVFAYAARRYGVRHFVIDSLMMLGDVPEDGPGAFSAQKSAVQKVTAFAKLHGGHMHLIAHPRKGGDESKAPGKLDVSGSSRITDAADNVFSVWSAGKEEGQQDDKPDALLELLKQRNGDVQHRKLWLWFNAAAKQYTTTSNRRTVAYVPFEGSLHTGRVEA
jgi:twinkle protein